MLALWTVHNTLTQTLFHIVLNYLSVCMVCMCAHMFLCVCVWFWECKSASVCVSVCMNVSVSVWVSVCAYMQKSEVVIRCLSWCSPHYIRQDFSHEPRAANLLCPASWLALEESHTYYFPSFFSLLTLTGGKDSLAIYAVLNITLLLFHGFHSEEVM